MDDGDVFEIPGITEVVEATPKLGQTLDAFREEAKIKPAVKESKPVSQVPDFGHEEDVRG